MYMLYAQYYITGVTELWNKYTLYLPAICSVKSGLYFFNPCKFSANM